MSSKEIASELGIAKTSVDTYCNRARAKLGVGGRHEAARLVRVAVVAEDSVAAAAGGYPFGLGDGAARSPLAPLTNATLRLLAAGIITTLAFGALMAGFHALDAMKPRRGLPTYYVSAAHPADRR